MDSTGLDLEGRGEKECGRGDDSLEILAPFNWAISQFRFFVGGTIGVSGLIPSALSLK